MNIYKAFFLANPLGIIMPQLEIQTNKLNFRGEWKTTTVKCCSYMFQSASVGSEATTKACTLSPYMDLYEVVGKQFILMALILFIKL